MPAPTHSITPLLSTAATMRVGRGDPVVWTPLTGLAGDIEWPEQVPADLDITNHGSGNTEENIPGMAPAVDFTAEMFKDTSTAGAAAHTALTALNTPDETTYLRELHLLEVTSADETVTFVAYVKDYRPIAPLKGVARRRATWRVMNKVANAA